MHKNYRYILKVFQGMFASIEEMNYRQKKMNYLSGPIDQTRLSSNTPRTPTEEEEEKHFDGLVTFWFGTFAMLFSATGCVVHHENT